MTTVKRMRKGENEFFILDRGLARWDLEATPPTDRDGFIAMRELLTELDRLAPSPGWDVVITDHLNGAIPTSPGRRVVVICLNDELARRPAYTTPVSVVFKTYGVQRRFIQNVQWSSGPKTLISSTLNELRCQQQRAASFVSGRALSRSRTCPTVDIPLGLLSPRSREFVPFSDRTYELVFLGSQVHGTEGRRLSPTEKYSSRRDLVKVLAQLKRSNPDLQMCIALRDSFAEAQRHRTDYSAALMNSRIAPCPRGMSLETYRYFEALAAGCIVVAENLPARYYYRDAPILQVRKWTELKAIVEHLRRDPRAAHELHHQALQWWQERCSPAATAQRMVRAMMVLDR
jgi:hypothetical protein